MLVPEVYPTTELQFKVREHHVNKISLIADTEHSGFWSGERGIQSLMSQPSLACRNVLKMKTNHTDSRKELLAVKTPSLRQRNMK